MAVCEDLATKAELQELRTQLNSLLGEKEDGSGYIEVFQAGGGLISTGAVAATAYLATKTKAASSLVDIKLLTGSGSPIWQELKNGTAKLTGFTGNGEQKVFEGVNKVTKTIGNNGNAAATATAVAAKSAAMMAVLMNLVNIGATLALNIATVKVLDYRIDQEARGTQFALDSLNDGMLRLYAKNQQDIAKVNEEIETSYEKIQASTNIIRGMESEVQQARDDNLFMRQDLDNARTAITTLQTELNDARNQINENTAEYQEVVDNLTGSINTVEAELGQALDIIQKHEQNIVKTDLKIADLVAKTVELDDKYTSLSLSYIHLRDEFSKLQQDLEDLEEFTNVRVEDLEGRVALAEKRHKLSSSSGGGGGAIRENAKTTAQVQNSILDLAAKNAGQTNTTEITNVDVLNNTTTFQDVFTDLLTDIQPGTMDEQQLEDFRTALGGDFSALLLAGLTATVIPDIANIKDNTSEKRMVNNTKQGICESLNSPDPCGTGGTGTGSGTGGIQGLKGMKDLLMGNLDSVNAVLNGTILTVVKNTNSVVNSATHGLQAMQNFASTAWRVTRADKVMQAVTTAVTIHNGMMLSNNLASTMSEALNVSLNALNIRDETNAPIDIGSFVSNKLQTMLTSLLGTENYAALTARIAKANRIYQSSVNTLHAINDLYDSARSVAELTAENTGKIGNALRESGAVYEDAYDEFTEKINPQSKAMRNLEKFRGAIDGISEPIETISQVSSEIIEIRENYQQLTEAKEEWKEEINTQVETQFAEKADAKIAALVDTDVEDTDFERNELTNTE